MVQMTIIRALALQKLQKQFQEPEAIKTKIRDEEVSFFTSHRPNEKRRDTVDDQIDQTAAARNKNANRY